MSTITTKDGTEIYYKDWGTGQPLFFHHGWPLSADDWDAQMMFFLERGYRVIAHDRRGHGRSTQTVTGNEMDTYAADVDELVAKADSAGRHSHRPFDRRRRSGPLRGSIRQRAGLQGRADQFGSAHHGQVRQESGRNADRGLRSDSRGHRQQSSPVLPGHHASVLRLQPAGSRHLSRRSGQLVASGHDGRNQGPLRLHQGIFGDRLSPKTSRRSRCPRWSCTEKTTRSYPSQMPARSQPSC